MSAVSPGKDFPAPPVAGERGQSNPVASFHKFESLRGRCQRYVGALAGGSRKTQTPFAAAVDSSRADL